MNTIQKYIMNQLTKYKNKRQDNQFRNKKFDGFSVVIMPEKLDKLYQKEINTIHLPELKWSFIEARQSFLMVDDWCGKQEGYVDIPFAINYEPTIFKFSRQEVAIQFQEKFLN